jgi:GT2 family glycosyltransferase
VLLFASPENPGIAAGNKRAEKTAIGELFLLPNPDGVILNEALDHLFAFATQYPQAMGRVSAIWERQY